MTVSPGVKVPQLMELMEVVHALSEYTLKPGDVKTLPAEAKLVDTVMAEKVVDKASPIMTEVIIAVNILSFGFAAIIPRNARSRFMKFMERDGFLKLFVLE